MKRLRFIMVAAGALAIGGAFGLAPAGAAVQGGADAIRAAAGAGAIAEQVQYRYGGYDYCWYESGWHGPGWYWCGYALRPGLGWGGPVGWNNWRWVERGDFYRDRDDFRYRRDRDDFRYRDRDDRRRY
jgi:hypothetical protein